MDDARLTRRASLVRLGGFLVGLLFAGSWRPGAAPAADAVACVLTPEQTEGPYYIAGEKLRRNITEGRPGVPLTLRATVVDATTCKPIRGAAVDVWHCDAGGTYSGFGNGAGNRTFMRGIQRTNANGVATFRTIYPGWYQGRTVHVHVKVHVGGNVVHTGQLYFPDALTDAVYRRKPYSSRPGRDVRNATDNVYRNGGRRSMLRLRKSGAGYVGAITMGVRR
jgi:protocatechuate 3,4-dioxygenase beta subunit